MGYIYYNYYMERLPLIAAGNKAFFKQLVRLNFWVYTIENSCLVGVSYIANVENYRKSKELFITIKFRTIPTPRFPYSLFFILLLTV